MVFKVGVIRGIYLLVLLLSPRNVLIEVHEAEQMVLSLESSKDFQGTQSIELVLRLFIIPRSVRHIRLVLSCIIPKIQW